MTQNRINKVSIIIPMFNTENFIETLLDSLCKQTLKEIEIICVDDGSIDGSKQIVEKMMKKDPRISYIYQKNQGAGVARNTGIVNAKGEYLICMDADDLYNYDMLEKMYKAAKDNDADEVFCGSLMNYYIDKVTYDAPNMNVKTVPVNAVINIDTTPSLIAAINLAPINKLYKRSFILNSKLEYSHSKTANDLFFSLSAVSIARRIVYVPDRFVTVRNEFNPDSITSSRGKSIQDNLQAFIDLISWAKRNNISKKIMIEFAKRAGGSFRYNSQFSQDDTIVSKTMELMNMDPLKSLSFNKKVEILHLNIPLYYKELSQYEHQLSKNKDNDQVEVITRKIVKQKARISSYEVLEKELLKGASIKEKLVYHLKKSYHMRNR